MHQHVSTCSWALSLLQLGTKRPLQEIVDLPQHRISRIHLLKLWKITHNTYYLVLLGTRSSSFIHLFSLDHRSPTLLLISFYYSHLYHVSVEIGVLQLQIWIWKAARFHVCGCIVTTDGNAIIGGWYHSLPLYGIEIHKADGRVACCGTDQHQPV